MFDAYEALKERAEPGEVVALDHVPKYEAMVHLEGSGLRLVPYVNGTSAEYVISGSPDPKYPGFTLVGVYGDSDGSALIPGFGASLWENENRSRGN